MDAMPRQFFDEQNQTRRCALEVIAQTKEVLFLLDRSSPQKKGHPGHVFTVRRDDVAVIDTSFFH
jgi:hypothetical protein